jgi:uncharacterized protein (TIGR04222 family)
MIEMLRQIPGPQFLCYYMVLAVFCIVIAFLWANADGTARLELPRLTEFNPIVIGYLRGGWKSVTLTAMFSLWNKRLLHITSTSSFLSGDEITVEGVPGSKTPLSKTEQAVYDFLRTPRSPGSVSKDPTLRDEIKVHLAPYNFELERSRLIKNIADRYRSWTATLVMLLVLVAVGGTKLYLGITHNRPSQNLAFLLQFSVAGLFYAVKPWANPTRLGKRYLETLKEKFDWMKGKIAASPSEGIDLVFCFAIFGISAIGGNTGIKEVLQAGNKGIAGSWGGCSGGGGCGGGGCGGCGGS